MNFSPSFDVVAFMVLIGSILIYYVKTSGERQVNELRIALMAKIDGLSHNSNNHVSDAMASLGTRIDALKESINSMNVSMRLAEERHLNIMSAMHKQDLRIQELYTYTHNRFHELANTMQKHEGRLMMMEQAAERAAGMD